MWINFSSYNPFAIKLYVGSINAVSGEPAVETMATSLRRLKLLSEQKSLQDYVVTPAQLWIDGIASQNGRVRQFVAMPVGSGYSVEAQITGEEVVAGLQFEITPRKAVPVPELKPVVMPRYFYEPVPPVPKPVYKPLGPVTAPDPNRFSYPKSTLSVGYRPGRQLSFSVNESYLISDIKTLLHEERGFPPEVWILSFDGRVLDDVRTWKGYDILSNPTNNKIVARLDRTSKA